MKQYFGLLILIGAFAGAFSIGAKSQSMPAFSIKLTNGKTFSSKNLSVQQPVIIIYFDPYCDHCQALMDTLFRKINYFKKSEIVLVTFKPLNEIKDFEKARQTSKYSNIRVGLEEPVFFFQVFYHLKNVPFTVLFDKSRKQVISYERYTPVDDLIKRLKSIN